MLLYYSFLFFWRKTQSERHDFAQFFNQGTWHYKSTAIAKSCAYWKLILKPSIFATFSKRAWKLICSHNITDDLRSDVCFFPDISKVDPTMLNDRFTEGKKFRRYQNPTYFQNAIWYENRSELRRKMDLSKKCCIFLSSWIQRRRVFNCVVVWWLNSSIDHG